MEIYIKKGKYNEELKNIKNISEELIINKLVKNDYNFYRTIAEIYFI